MGTQPQRAAKQVKQRLSEMANRMLVASGTFLQKQEAANSSQCTSWQLPTPNRWDADCSVSHHKDKRRLQKKWWLARQKENSPGNTEVSQQGMLTRDATCQQARQAITWGPRLLVGPPEGWQTLNNSSVNANEKKMKRKKKQDSDKLSW